MDKSDFFKIPKLDFLRTRLKSLSWRGKVPKAEGVIWNLVSNKCYFWSNLNFNFQLTSNRYDLVLLGKYAQLTKIHYRPKRTLKHNKYLQKCQLSLLKKVCRVVFQHPIWEERTESLRIHKLYAKQCLTLKLLSGSAWPTNLNKFYKSFNSF